MTDLDKMARELLANCLDDFGHPQEARNVRDGEDLESYEVELRLIRKLHAYGCLRLTSEPLTAPPGYVLVPVGDDDRHRQAAARLGGELARMKGEVRHLQSVLGRLMQDGRLLDELERAWFFQPPAERVRLASAPCWAAGQHSSLREALRSALLAAAPEVR